MRIVFTQQVTLILFLRSFYKLPYTVGLRLFLCYHVRNLVGIYSLDKLVRKGSKSIEQTDSYDLVSVLEDLQAKGRPALSTWHKMDQMYV